MVNKMKKTAEPTGRKTRSQRAKQLEEGIQASPPQSLSSAPPKVSKKPAPKKSRSKQTKANTPPPVVDNTPDPSSSSSETTQITIAPVISSSSEPTETPVDTAASSSTQTTTVQAEEASEPSDSESIQVDTDISIDVPYVELQNTSSRGTKPGSSFVLPDLETPTLLLRGKNPKSSTVSPPGPPNCRSWATQTGSPTYTSTGTDPESTALPVLAPLYNEDYNRATPHASVLIQMDYHKVPGIKYTSQPIHFAVPADVIDEILFRTARHKLVKPTTLRNLYHDYSSLIAKKLIAEPTSKKNTKWVLEQYDAEGKFHYGRWVEVEIPEPPPPPLPYNENEIPSVKDLLPPEPPRHSVISHTPSPLPQPQEQSLEPSTQNHEQPAQVPEESRDVSMQEDEAPEPSVQAASNQEETPETPRPLSWALNGILRTAGSVKRLLPRPFSTPFSTRIVSSRRRSSTPPRARVSNPRALEMFDCQGPNPHPIDFGPRYNVRVDPPEPVIPSPSEVEKTHTEVNQQTNAVGDRSIDSDTAMDDSFAPFDPSSERANIPIPVITGHKRAIHHDYSNLWHRKYGEKVPKSFMTTEQWLKAFQKMQEEKTYEYKSKELEKEKARFNQERAEFEAQRAAEEARRLKAEADLKEEQRVAEEARLEAIEAAKRPPPGWRVPSPTTSDNEYDDLHEELEEVKAQHLPAGLYVAECHRIRGKHYELARIRKERQYHARVEDADEDEAEVDNPYRAQPYTGTMFALPKTPSQSQDRNVFDTTLPSKRAAVRSDDFNHEGHFKVPSPGDPDWEDSTILSEDASTSENAAVRSDDINHDGRFKVPSPGDPDWEDSTILSGDGRSPDASTAQSPLQVSPLASKQSQPLQAAEASTEASSSMAPPPRPNPTHASLPPTLPALSRPAPVFDPVEKERQKALKHQPITGSRLRESSRLSSSPVPSLVGNVESPAHDEYDPKRPAIVTSTSPSTDSLVITSPTALGGSAWGTMPGTASDTLPWPGYVNSFEEFTMSTSARVANLIESSFTDEDVEMAEDDFDKAMDDYEAMEIDGDVVPSAYDDTIDAESITDDEYIGIPLTPRVQKLINTSWTPQHDEASQQYFNDAFHGSLLGSPLLQSSPRLHM